MVYASGWRFGALPESSNLPVFRLGDLSLVVGGGSSSNAHPGKHRSGKSTKLLTSLVMHLQHATQITALASVPADGQEVPGGLSTGNFPMGRPRICLIAAGI
jgi:hypothetical protein